MDLYRHLFRTLDKVRKIPLLGNVHEKCFGTLSAMFIFMIAMLVLLFAGVICSIPFIIYKGIFLFKNNRCK